MMQRCIVAVAGFLLILSSSSLRSAEALIVYTVNYPLQYFAQRIAGDHARVVFPAPPDVDPAAWMPDHKTIEDYRRADLIILNGAAYAGWVSKVSLPRRHLIDTSKAFKDSYIMAEDTVGHSHDSSGEHSHTGVASITWLDFHQATQQAQAIAEALSRERPEHQSDFENNYTVLQKDLMALDLALQQTVAAKPGQLLFASHPVYHYLARRYELHIENILWKPDEMPDNQQWQQLRFVQESFPADWMLWENQPLPQIAQQLGDMGIDIAVFDPCASRPAANDFLSVMRDNIASLRRVYTD